MNTERLKNAALILCLFIVLVVIFSSYFRASEVGTFFGALTGTPLERLLNEALRAVSVA